jgi:hypothetical protein
MDAAKLGKEGVVRFFGRPSLFYNIPSWLQSIFQIGFLKSQGF